MAITTNWQFDLNGVTMGQGATLAGTGSTIVFTEVSGLDLPEINATVSARSNAHGSFVTAKYKKERVVTMTGRLNTTAANYGADTYALKKIFSPQDPAIPLTFRIPGFANQFMNVNPQGVRYAVQNTATAVGWVDFLAVLTAGDPRIYASAQSSATLAVGVGQTLTNNGNDAAPTNIVFTGPLTNPLLTDSTTGATFGLTVVIGAGTSYSANSTDCTVITGSTSAYSKITPSAKTFIELVSGGNSCTLTTGSGTGTATVQWRDTWA